MDAEQVALLKKCSEAHDFTEWNTWLEERRKDKYGFLPNLRAADLAGANFTGANLAGVDLYLANLTGANLRGVDLSQADLTGTHLGGVDLREANLRGANLYVADLSGANLNGVRLAETHHLQLAIFRWGRLSGADLRGASLIGTALDGANLSGADLRGADLRWAHLTGVDFTSTCLDDTDFSRATLGTLTVIQGREFYQPTVIANVDLRTVKGLETVQHFGPSTIGIDTLYKSGGNIPEVFLRGCGVPDIMVTFARSLVGKPIEFYSAFISYSSKDQEFAERLHADLQAKGVRVWFAPKDMPIGAPIVKEIDESIRLYDKLMVVLSENSLKSPWVDYELTLALDNEQRKGRTILFPIRIDDAVMHQPAGWAARLRTRHIGDFTRWKEHDEYQKAFAVLLRDLTAQGNEAVV
ncbi:MAG: toll/interleukin-1 receptor domain-containing protein [Anaerolineae bacterium]